MNHTNLKIKTGPCIGLALFIIFSALLGIFLIFMPKYVDDYEFMRSLRGWYESQGIWYPTEGGNIWKAGIPWDSVVETWRHHYENDNSRLSNVTAVLFELLPKWVGSGLAWLSWCYAMKEVLQLAGVRMRQYALVSISIFLWTVIMPWRDNMGVMDYQFNYVLPSGLAILLLSRLQRGRRGRWGHVANVGLALLTGAWTEAFSVPIFTGLALTAALNKESRCQAVWEVLGGLGIGIIWILTCPHFSSRAGDEILMHAGDFKFLFKLLVTEHPGITVLTVMSVIYVAKMGWKNLKDDRKMLFTLTSAFASFGICCITSGSLRSGWWCAFASVFGTIYMINRLWGRKFDVSNCLSVVIALILTVFVWSALMPEDAYVLKTRREYRETLRAFLDNPEETIYVDASTDMDVPLLSRLFHSQWLYWEYYEFQNRYLFGGDGKSVNIWKIIPEGLKHFKAEDGKRVEGNMGVIRKDDFLVMPYKGKSGINGTADIRFGRIEKKEVPVRIIPYRSGGDGEEYGFIILMDRILEYKLFGINSMSNFKEDEE